MRRPKDLRIFTHMLTREVQKYLAIRKTVREDENKNPASPQVKNVRWQLWKNQKMYEQNETNKWLSHGMKTSNKMIHLY